ncbi:NAD-dependent epimerase/dehydratase family protein [Mucilaginibacter paludis]|uniref:NAD-dependent epimerase/dehydratase n=1 Tax=Mucilaginibacter paludis DSM 18603 TaxID=714943 RepID=H1Y1B7_9SPHI|nr:NAD(P)-dependent oxidoreductase [Mucilaginibacter paludis]EHQ30251.1 NAD-dependent epimerase/dehydratase [Mucilaginibacter paludis DSM 18603]
MKERVLITGASGFVGYHLIEHALINNLEIFAAVRHTSKTDHLKEFDIQYTDINFEDVDALKKELEEKQYTYIIHAAGVTAAKTQQDYNRINAQYTYNLALAASQANIPLKKFVFLSSLAALGPLLTINGIIEDDTPPRPVTAYGRSKLLAEQKLLSIPQLPLITLRPTAVYGPRDTGIYIILKQFSKGFEPYIGKIEQRLSFVYVSDLANIAVKALQSPITGKTYNVSDGKAYSRYALADFTKQILNKKTYKVHLPVVVIKVLAGVLEKVYARSNKTPALNIEKLDELNAANWICDIENISRDLNYLPAYDLNKGLETTFAWYKKNNWL